MSSSPRFLAAGQKYLPGIYGGVGPLSHTLFEQQMLASRHRRGARSDQDHPVWLLVSASSTPNRMESLSGQGKSAEPYLRHFAQLLEGAGADILFVACNTAHAYHEAVQRTLRIPWVHLMDATAAHVRHALPDVARVGILGTDGTLNTRLYHVALEKLGLEPIAPAVGSDAQRLIMNAIFDPGWGIKATGAAVSDRARADLASAARWCVAAGAQAVVAACTEVSVGLTAESFRTAPVLDPLAIAADLAIDVAYGLRQPAEFLVRYDRA
jgi:aspartate racemase